MLYSYVTNCKMISYSKWATVLNSVQVINPLFWTQWKRHIIPFITEIAFWTPHVLAWPWLFWCEVRPYQGLQPKEIFRKERRGENRGFVFIILWYCAVKTCHLSGYSCVLGTKMVMKNSLWLGIWGNTSPPLTRSLTLCDTFISSFWKIFISSDIIKICPCQRTWFL